MKLSIQLFYTEFIIKYDGILLNYIRKIKYFKLNMKIQLDTKSILYLVKIKLKHFF